MRFLVQLPVVFRLEIVAESLEQAGSLGEAEVFRLSDLMSGLSERDSPDYCISFYTDFSGKIFVSEEESGLPLSES